METNLLYLILFILLFQLFVLVVLSFKPKDNCCKKDCCCEGKKLCKCEDIYDDRTQEIKTACCKDDYSDCTCELPDPFKINTFPSKKTTISSLGTPENRTNTFRGSPYQDLKDSEPLEENNPNINKK